MSFTPAQTKSLESGLDRKHVRQREQAGRRFSYVEGWHAIAEANRIFGFGEWSSETVDIRCVSEGPRKIGKQQRDGYAVSYIARVRVTVQAGEQTVVREGVGSGHGIDVDLGLAHESAIKESETDARKRALMTFGNPFGLALYDKDQANVVDGVSGEDPAEVARRFIADCERGIEAEADRDALLGWWNSAERKDAFRQNHLTNEEAADLGECVKRRAAVLTPVPRAAA